MRTLSTEGRIEIGKIDSQLERAKIALLLAKFEERGDFAFLEQAKRIAVRNNGYWEVVSSCSGDLDHLLNREREERFQLTLF